LPLHDALPIWTLGSFTATGPDNLGHIELGLRPVLITRPDNLLDMKSDVSVLVIFTEQVADRITDDRPKALTDLFTESFGKTTSSPDTDIESFFENIGGRAEQLLQQPLSAHTYSKRRKPNRATPIDTADHAR